MSKNKSKSHKHDKAAKVHLPVPTPPVIGAYNDGTPFDQIQFLEAKLILKPDRFTSVKAFRQFDRLVAKVAKASGVGYTPNPKAPERPEIREQIPTWSPIDMQALPFPSVLLGSRNDPYCDVQRASDFAEAWGSAFIDAGEAGHINIESGHGPWPEGLMSFAGFISKL